MVAGFIPSEKYHLGSFFPTYGKVKHVPNHRIHGLVPDFHFAEDFFRWTIRGTSKNADT